MNANKANKALETISFPWNAKAYDTSDRGTVLVFVAPNGDKRATGIDNNMGADDVRMLATGLVLTYCAGNKVAA